MLQAQCQKMLRRLCGKRSAASCGCDASGSDCSGCTACSSAARTGRPPSRPASSSGAWCTSAACASGRSTWRRWAAATSRPPSCAATPPSCTACCAGSTASSTSSTVSLSVASTSFCSSNTTGALAPDGRFERINFVCEFVCHLVTRFDMDSAEFSRRLGLVLLQNTEHFVHEFLCFAQSPFEMDEYDRQISYEHSAPPAPPSDDDAQPATGGDVLVDFLLGPVSQLFERDDEPAAAGGWP